MIFGCFFGVIGVLSGLVGTMLSSEVAYADPIDGNVQTGISEGLNDVSNMAADEAGDDLQEATDEIEGGTSGDTCKDSLGAIGWLVCPTTGKISEAVDWLYDKIEEILVINPVEMKDGSPIYEIWKYMLGVTNIVFIIFLLVVVYSQLTGYGITNYGIKKTLPKLIVAAILVNLSFVICSIAVDLSNIVGNSLRGLFTSIEETTMSSMNITGGMKMSEMYASLAGGSTLAIGAGMVAFETGAIWMLIPTILGAIVSVVIGLITIALRQAVVALLIMIAPLAIVAYILPNTDKWFKKWKDLLVKMLVFYPMFSLLFGASSLAGWAIIASASDGFGVILGVAVQIFPLFFSWSLMKMSGTVLGTINSKLTGLAAKPLAASRSWAESRRDNTKAKMLASNNAYTPSQRLMQYLSDRKIAREEETKERNETIKNRGLVYGVNKNYRKDGTPSREGEESYEMQGRNLRYMEIINRHKNNMNKGLGQLEVVKANASTAQMARLGKLDKLNVDAADDLKAELARGAEIEYQNAKGFLKRTLDAKFAEGDNRALLTGNNRHQMHPGVLDDSDNLARYERFKKIMEGQDDGVQTVLADAASSANAQIQIRRNKFQAAADLTPATQNVADHINDLVMSPNAVKNIDAIIGGLRVLNMRGDTDIVAKKLEHDLVGVLSNSGKIELGTYASQAIANYTMFDVGKNDPVLRRFGKYINMQTAALYNDGDLEERRKRKDVSWWEYVNSGYVEYDDNGNAVRDENGNVVVKKTRGMRELMPGTSYSGVERTAYKSQREGVRAASRDIGLDGKLSPEFSLKRYFDNMDGLYDSTLANIIGDQFAYLSGSEQIVSLAKDLTGIGKDGKWDWKYIFGDELPNPSLEQKAEFIIRSRNLVKKFLGGHVPSQIARSKTDMLQAIEAQYALLDAVMRINDEGEEVVDLERLKELEERTFTDGNENDPDSYKYFLKEKRSAVKDRFQKSFKEDAIKGFAKQFKKGYQGEAKDLLIKLADPEALYDYYYGSHGKERPQRRTQNDEEDGIPVENNLNDSVPSGGVYNDARGRIQEIFERYRGPEGLNVEDCWNEVSDVLESATEMGDLSVALSEFTEGISQYTDVSQLRSDIMRIFFGDR